MKYVSTALMAVAALILLAAPATADELDGQILKFQQVPQDGPEYFGHDELSRAYLDGNIYYGQFMADDFADEFNTPVVHVKWWGSYINGVGEPDAVNADGGVQRFLISFESDVPDPNPNEPDTFSQPGDPILNQVVSRGDLSPKSGTFTETRISDGGAPLHETLYQYNAELKAEFSQDPNTVYWLKIVALVNSEAEGDIDWGWHNRDYTVQDTLAPDPVVLSPGEHIDGYITDSGAEQPIWHFQDDAVSGLIEIIPDAGTVGDIQVIQTYPLGWHPPQNYVDMWDGPDGISGYSKDLAFELYTVPEPGTVAMLIGAGLIGLVAFARRRKS